MKIFIKIFFLLLFLLKANFYQAQASLADTSRILERMILDGDTLYVTTLEEIYIYPKKKFKNRRQYRRYSRLIRNVKAAYPYAVMAREKYVKLNDQLEGEPNEKQHKEIIKQLEKEIMDEYEEELKKLTITQGRILLKLIDRELGNTSYEVVKELKGSFSAIFWQTIARIFGSNLKSEYDPTGEDKDIEEIVKLIELGLI